MTIAFGDWASYPEVENMLSHVRDMRVGHPIRNQAAIEAIQLSQAISLKRIADSLTILVEDLNTFDKYGLTGTAAIAMAVRDGIREGLGK